jgi:type II secretion system protein D
MNKQKRFRRRRHNVAVLACLLASWTACAALAQAPAGRPAGIAPAAESVATVQGYPVEGADVLGVAQRLQEMFARRADVKIAGDPRLRQIVVIGPADAQSQIAGWLAEQRLSPAGVQQAPAAARPQNAPASQGPQPLTTQSWQLRNLNWKDFETRLLKTWGSKLEASQDSVGDMATFRFPPTAAGTASIVVDRRTNVVTISAPQSSAASWQRLLAVLDSRPASPDEQTSLVPLSSADPATIQRAVALIQQVAAGNDSRSPAAASAVDPHRKRHIGQFVSMIFQPEAGAAAQPPAGAAEAIQAGGAPSGLVSEIARISNVQIEILDDVVIVRGRAQDVERVMEIIEQIEQQSLTFKPEVEIYYLKHVNGEALSAMIQQVYAAVFSRQGPVTIVPLVKPNALLLIGRKENIPAVVELIQKLDQPAPPDSEFKIFQLKYISAIDAERVVRQFFVDRPGFGTTLKAGLGTRVLAIAEYRANVLMVQASPRDMVEVVHLIESIDVESSMVKNEVRIIKLHNSIATELAPTLQEAITGTTATNAAAAPVAGAGGGGGGAGGAGGAGGTTSPARAIPPALNLQFLQVGAGGQEIIQSGILATMRISADTRSNALIIVGPASAMNLMEAVVQQLDQLPTTVAQVKVFTLKNGDATALADMLSNLFGVAQAGAAAGGAAGAVQTATGGGESTLVPLRFSVDQRTNTIIASGNPGDLDVIFALLTRLDQGDVRQRITTVYRLKNAPAADVATALTGLLSQQLQLIQAAPELVTPVETLDRQVIVVSEVVTNSLIVSATPRYLEEIKRIIDSLDRRPPMVAIQVVIAEVRLNDTEQFGVEWGLQDALMFQRSASATGNRFNFEGPGTINLPNDATPASLATAKNVAGQALANFGLGRTDPVLGFGGLVLTASSESVSVLLRALEVSTRAQIISRPQVQTLDNQAAFVQVGSLVPRITSSTLSTAGVSNGTADTNVGIILQVTPRTSPDGMINLVISAEKSAVGPDATGIPISINAAGQVIRSPQILITTAQTTVAAKSGQTVILGGLITKDQEEITNRIPYLADIPVLGRLFRFDTVTNARTELLIIMTPYLVQTDEQVDWVNLRETERMSWCVADIVNIHGPVPVSGNPGFNGGPTPLIFPDLQPSAPSSVPGQPTPAGPPGSVPAPPPAMPPAATPADLRPLTPGYWPFPPYPAGTPLPPSTMPLTPSAPSGPSGGSYPMGYGSGPLPGPMATPPPGMMSAPPIVTSAPPMSILTPQPQRLMPPPLAPQTQNPLVPQTIQPAAPPAGTPEPPPPSLSLGPYPPPGALVPAMFQQPVNR